MFRVTVWKSGTAYQYQVGLKQLLKEWRAWTRDTTCTAIIIHKIQGDQE